MQCLMRRQLAKKKVSDAKWQTTLKAIVQLEGNCGGGGAAKDAAVPAATYGRVRNVVVFISALPGISLVVAIVMGAEEDGHAELHLKHATLAKNASTQIASLLVPLALTAVVVYFFGTLDSSEVGPRASRLLRAWAIATGALQCAPWAISGMWSQVGSTLLFYWGGIACGIAWCCEAMRACLRERYGAAGVAAQAQAHMSRLLSIASIQAALLVQGLATGIGRKEPRFCARVLSNFTFSSSLTFSYLLSVLVFEVDEVRRRVARGMRRRSAPQAVGRRPPRRRSPCPRPSPSAPVCTKRSTRCGSAACACRAARPPRSARRTSLCLRASRCSSSPSRTGRTCASSSRRVGSGSSRSSLRG